MEDYTSKLPEAIIHHILFFLTPKESAQARLLSKEWFNAWQTCPNLRFDESYIDHRGKFLYFVNKVLQNYDQHNNGIRSLKIKMDILNEHDEDDSSHLVDEWIKIATKNGLKRLELSFFQRYLLPSTVLKAKYLEEMLLYFCKFEQDVIEEVICFNLRKLELHCVSLNDEVLQKIISNCRWIEDLVIYACEGLRKIKVTNLKKLKRFFVLYSEMQSVEVEAQNLESFYCWRYECQGNKWRPDSICLFPLGNLKVLELIGIGISDIFCLDFTNKFPNLEDLTMSCCDQLQRLLISSNSIRILNLKDNKKLKVLNIYAPKIVLFKYHGNSIPIVKFTSALSHCKSKIFISCSDTMNDSWFFELKALLTNLVQSKIFLKISMDWSVRIFVNEIRDGVVSPGCEIQSLSLVFTILEPAVFPAVLNVFFWNCHPKRIKLSLSNQTVDFANFLYEMLIDRRNRGHPNLQETRFWEKDLEDVKVVILKRPGREWEPELLDWKTLLKVDPYFDQCRRVIHFNLEWQTSIQFLN